MIPLNPLKYLRFGTRFWRYRSKYKDQTSLSFLEQAREIAYLLQHNRLEINEYFETYALHQPDVSWEEKRRFLSRNQFAAYRAAMNPDHSIGVLNKLAFKLYALHFNLPVPKMLGLFDQHHGFTGGGKALCTVADLDLFLHTEAPSKFLFKPIGSDKATGTFVCARQGEDVVVLGEGPTSVAALHQRLSDKHFNGDPYINDSWLVEQFVDPHPWFHRYSKNYCHHYRIVTFLTNSGQIEHLMTTVGIGLSEQHIHKAGPLGMAAGMTSNGVLMAAVRSADRGIEFLDNHPESGARITGERPPLYQECLAAAIRAHSCIPHLRSLGWDIAPSEDGPRIFEGNSYWNWEKLQRANRRGLIHGALAKELPAILNW